MFAVAPYLLASIVINVVVNRSFQKRTISFSSKSELFSIVSASLIGLVSPLPTYAAIPIGLSLMTAGIPFSAVIAFVISSPLINPSIFFLTATQMGLEMALARTLSAFVIGLLGGLFAKKLHSLLYTKNIEASTGQIFQQKPKRSLVMDTWRNTVYVVKYFSIAIFLSAAVKALVAPETISALLGGDAKTSTLLAIGLGVPFYTCGGAAIPFIKTLMELGMSKGATLAFFIAGPATKLETLYAFRRLLGVRVLIFYLILTFTFSYLSGILYSFF